MQQGSVETLYQNGNSLEQIADIIIIMQRLTRRVSVIRMTNRRRIGYTLGIVTIDSVTSVVMNYVKRND